MVHLVGCFDRETNDAVLRGVSRALRPGGRLLLEMRHTEHLPRLIELAGGCANVVLERHGGLLIDRIREGGGSRTLVSKSRISSVPTEAAQFLHSTRKKGDSSFSPESVIDVVVDDQADLLVSEQEPALADDEVGMGLEDHRLDRFLQEAPAQERDDLLDRVGNFAAVVLLCPLKSQ